MSGIATPAGRAAWTAAAALRQDLAELRLVGGRAPFCAMAALAVAISVVAALAADMQDVWWAAISGFISTQTTAPASLQRGLLRILGTAAGAAFAVLLCPWLVEDQVALCLVLLVASTAGVLGLSVSPHGYAWLLAGITIDMVLLAALADPLSALETACNRTAEVTIGTASAVLVALLLAPATAAAPAPPPPGWRDLLGAQWPAVEHALRAGVGAMLVPVVWNLLDLPSLSQTAITIAAVMAVPAPPTDAEEGARTIIQRAVQRLIGCVLGGVMGLAILALSLDSFLPWLLLLMAGLWVCAHLQGSTRGMGYVGIQAAMVFISTMVQGNGPPTSILPGIERLTGIVGGLLILLAVSLVSAPRGK